MKRCDYCGKVAEYGGQPHGIEDCAEHLRLENARLRQQVENVRALIPYWERHRQEAGDNDQSFYSTTLKLCMIDLQYALVEGAEAGGEGSG